MNQDEFMNQDELLDDDGYPTDTALEWITSFPVRDDGDDVKLLEFCKKLWHFPEYAYRDGRWFYLNTCGWSGNEKIIFSLQRNWLFWACHWYSSRRGGHHVFEVKNED